MEPHISDGERVIFAPCPGVKPKDSDIVILQWKGRTMIRGIEFEGDEITLIPTNKINNTYEAIKTHKKDSRLCILGVVIGKAPDIIPIKGIW